MISRFLKRRFSDSSSSLRKFASKAKSKSRQRNLARKIRIEQLEERAMFAIVQWITNGNGNWEDAANWLDTSNSTNHVPTSNDDVIINVASGSYSISVNSGTQQAKTISTSGAWISRQRHNQHPR